MFKTQDLLWCWRWACSY